MSEKTLILTKELAEAEFELREALGDLLEVETRVRKANGWHAEILRLLEEEDRHG